MTRKQSRTSFTPMVAPTPKKVSFSMDKELESSGEINLGV